MDAQEVESRIQKIIGRKEQYPITREDGTEKLINRMPAGSVDASVPAPVEQINREAEAQRSRPPQPATEITMVDPTEAQAEQVTIGDRVVIRPSGLVGFEKAFTRNAADHEVFLDGERVIGLDAILKVIYDALREQQAAKKAGKR